MFLDLQKARFLPWLPGVAARLGARLPRATRSASRCRAELAHVRFWRDRRAQRALGQPYTRAVSRRAAASPRSASRTERLPAPRRRRGRAARSARVSVGAATPFKDGANGRLFRSGPWILKQHASARAARRAWLGGSGLEARGFATGRALAWVGRWLVMEDGGATLDALGDGATSRARDAAQRAELARALGSLLAALHRRGVYHADLKANNVLWSPGREPRLLDYGRVRFARARLAAPAREEPGAAQRRAARRGARRRCARPRSRATSPRAATATTPRGCAATSSRRACAAPTVGSGC